MKLTWKHLFTAAVLFAVAAVAAPFAIDEVTRNMKGGFFAGSAAAATSTNKVTRTLGACATIDFATATIVCRDSTGITVTGAAVGDPCFVGMPATLTAGGTGLHDTFSCYVSAADTVKVRACAAGTADDPGNVQYCVRVISAQ